MTNEQIEKAAMLAACDYDNPDDEPCYDKNFYDGFIAGAKYALAHQWVSVEDAMPEDDRYFYLVADARLDPLGVDCAEYTCENKLFSRSGKILHPTHWCVIPQLNPEKEER